MCPSCEQIDKLPDIQRIITLEKFLYRLVYLTARYLNQADPSEDQRFSERILTKSDKMHMEFLKASKTLPRFISKCE